MPIIASLPLLAQGLGQAQSAQVDVARVVRRSVEANRTDWNAAPQFSYNEQEQDTQLAHGGVRNVPGSVIVDFRGSWSNAVEEEAHRLHRSDIPANLLFHDLGRSAVRVMIQDAGIPEAQAMLINGHVTRAMLELYNIVSLKNIKDAGSKLDAWASARKQQSARW